MNGRVRKRKKERRIGGKRRGENEGKRNEKERVRE
jgi:hypothetical protein